MQFAEEAKEEYQEWRNKNVESCKTPQDSQYVMSCIGFTEEWADALEKEIESGKKLEGIAMNIAYKIGKKYNMSWFQFGYACSVLSKFWIHREPFSKWWATERAR